MGSSKYFRKKIKFFYLEHKRSFYWREKKLTPFQILITELFLQKTRAETAEKIIINFIYKYPNNKILLQTKDSELYETIKVLGLGKQRTMALGNISKYLHEHYNDEVPDNKKDLELIPHVGLYIRNAVLCFAFNKRISIVDVNVARVLSRFFSIENKKDIRHNKKLQEKAEELVPREKVKEYNWGVLDLAALVCKPKPLCVICSLRRKCNYYSKKNN